MLSYSVFSRSHYWGKPSSVLHQQRQTQYMGPMLDYFLGKILSYSQD